jgi:NTP pyrophosphatase (non-canonical NTP hydrolase)
MKENSIMEMIGEAAMLEQLAEEAAELAKAALKKARILRRENPTPVGLDEADKSLIEEYTDVVQCAKELQLEWDLLQVYNKHERWMKRLREKPESPIKSQVPRKPLTLEPDTTDDPPYHP